MVDLMMTRDAQQLKVRYEIVLGSLVDMVNVAASTGCSQLKYLTPASSARVREFVMKIP